MTKIDELYALHDKHMELNAEYEKLADPTMEQYLVWANATNVILNRMLVLNGLEPVLNEHLGDKAKNPR